MTVRVRFAPSPTGELHVGNARTALINALFARRAGGAFLLRFDDTDAQRSREVYVEATRRDLNWLGITWNGSVRQSERLALYDEAAARLRAAERLYACYETPEELEYKRRRLLARGAPPIYDRAALRLSADDRAALEAEGRTPHWRFRFADEPIVWDDLIRGPVRFDPAHLSDPVLIRADRTYLYMLPSTVDDIALAITHVIRGEDHVANTAVQIALFRALGATPPTFGHLPLLTDVAGQGLSKRLGSLTLAQLRDEGIEAMALNAYLSGLGTGEAIGEPRSLDELCAGFDVTHFGRATPKFDDQQLRAANERWLHSCPFAIARPRLQAMGLERIDAALWEVIRPNLGRFADAQIWHDVCFGTIAPVIADPALIAQAAAMLPDEPWSEQTWDAWTSAVRSACGRSGKALFQPLRLALTGREHGPNLRGLLPCIGRDKALSRLQGLPA